MPLLTRIILVVIFVPLAIVLVTLSIANRGLTAVTLDPFHPGNPALTLALPLFVWLFAAVILGVVIGGAVTWARQGFYRRLARRRGREAESLRQAARAGTAAPNRPTPALPALAALPKPSR